MNFTPTRIVAALWTVIFAALQMILVAWSGRGRLPVDLPHVVGRTADYGIAVIGGLLVAAAIALWGRRWMLILVGLLALARGLAGIGYLGYRVSVGGSIDADRWWVPAAFVLGAVLFMIAQRKARQGQDALPGSGAELSSGDRPGCRG
ncbi:hypothetical protein FOE78_03985 [Microlunatus elymi]|uniref:DUF4345 domain-containing protein n=1 Tax=Microlunatus elymi TaxID=2596828 RepID=A0A516PVG7_9ACTN|nr:hypothetical protein [Microlunatus elymi]QDP95187.1 hypothetical protein FOE78_03985 [Microlunatus elymi]